MDDREQLLEQTIRRYVRPGSRVVGFDARPMRESERGYSSAQVERQVVAFRTPEGEAETITLITKEASLPERRVLDLLTSQAQCVPFSHTLDLTTDRPMLVCQQDWVAGQLGSLHGSLLDQLLHGNLRSSPL